MRDLLRYLLVVLLGKAKMKNECGETKPGEDAIRITTNETINGKYAPNGPIPQSSNGTSVEQIPDTNSGHARVPQTLRIPSIAENAQHSHEFLHHSKRICT